jgi:hypothetical protein
MTFDDDEDEDDEDASSCEAVGALQREAASATVHPRGSRRWQSKMREATSALVALVQARTASSTCSSAGARFRHSALAKGSTEPPKEHMLRSKSLVTASPRTSACF